MINAKNWRQPKYPFIHSEINKLFYIRWISMHIAEWEKPVWKAVKFYLHNILEKTELQRWYCSMVLRGSRVGRLNKWYTGGIWRVMKLFSCDTVMANGLPWWLISKESACNAGTMETQIWFLGREESLEEGMATHSSILACRIPRTEELSRLQSTRLQRVIHDWSDSACT